MKLALASLLLLTGCAPIIHELKSGPYPLAMTHHTRVVGLQLSYQGYGIQFGFCSDTITFLPCSTNTINAPAFSDRFKVGQSGFDTTITEQIDSGFTGQPPPPMQMFRPEPPKAP